jgi:L-2-hydroxyglutarate oxidase LhgO
MQLSRAADATRMNAGLTTDLHPAPPAAPLAQTTDFLVVGGGIMGVSLALQLRQRYRDSRVTLVEKEPTCGLHASGRNSGVLHAGFYYGAESLKARFSRDGAKQLTEYCTERGLRINRCGKLVVARDADDLRGLAELRSRGRANGVSLEEVAADDVHRIDPRAKTYDRALFSPSTASIDPVEVLTSLLEDAREEGVDVRTGVAYLGRDRYAVRTTAGPIAAGYVVNAAGLYADRIARDYGFSERYRILPFKGLYLQAEPGTPPFRTHIYPVPDLRNPFLGVHVTVTVDGGATLGPTALPAFWREQYGGLRNFNVAECASIVAREAALLMRDDFGFRRLAIGELRNCSRRRIVAHASALAEGIRPAHFRRWGRPGIRAQLFDVVARKLEMDFRFEGDDRSFHLLNAVSPAFTCSMPFSAYLADRIGQLVA